DHAAREHDVDRQRQLGLQPLTDAARAGDEPVDLVGDRAGIGEQCAARLGQLGPARSLAVEQRDSELRLERGDAVADYRKRPAELAGRAIEAPLLGDGEEDAELVDGRLADIHYSTNSNIWIDFIPVFSNGCNRHLVRNVPILSRTRTMIELRPYSSLGGADHGWLDTKHHFSFADYHDPARTNWGQLRVWNDDEIAPKTGFPPHPHRDIEIITYVRSGAISHKDSLGNSGRTEAGDVQVMSAGTGIQHAEYNLEDEITRIFQIWI